MRRVLITAYGGVEGLAVVDDDPPEPAPGELLVRLQVAGLNFHDVAQRRGVHRGMPPPPVPAGVEGTGVVAMIGPGDTEFDLGQRVVWANVAGSHAEFVRVPAAVAVAVPEDMPAPTAAALFAQGLTAEYLTSSVVAVEPGHTALVYAAAGGVGRLLTRIFTTRGGRVLAAVSHPEKAGTALAAGATRVVEYHELPSAAREFTAGRGVDVVFDSIGAPTFRRSLASVRPRGVLVLYGAAGGPTPPIDVLDLAAAGSVGVVRPRLMDFIANREELLARAARLFSAWRSGDLHVHVAGTYALSDIAAAHEALESRKLSGKVLLEPRDAT